MPSDNQLCTVLLLVAFGLLIHHLCKTNNRDLKTERFANEVAKIVPTATGPALSPPSPPAVAAPVKRAFI